MILPFLDISDECSHHRHHAVAQLFSWALLCSHWKRKLLEAGDYGTMKGHTTKAVKATETLQFLQHSRSESLFRAEHTTGLGAEGCTSPALRSCYLAGPCTGSYGASAPAFWGHWGGLQPLIPVCASSFQLVHRLVYYTQPWKLQGFGLNLNHLILK